MFSYFFPFHFFFFDPGASSLGCLELVVSPFLWLPSGWNEVHFLLIIFHLILPFLEFHSMCVFLCLFTWSCVKVYMEAWAQPWVSFIKSCPSLGFSSWISHWFGLLNSARVASWMEGARPLLISAFPVLALQTHTTTSSIFRKVQVLGLTSLLVGFLFVCQSDKSWNYLRRGNQLRQKGGGSQ